MDLLFPFLQLVLQTPLLYAWNISLSLFLTPFFTVANWDSMGRVVTQTLGRAFQTSTQPSVLLKRVYGNIHCSLLWLIFLIYILSTTLATIPWGTRPVTSQFVAWVIYVKYPNTDLITNIWKRKKGREKRKRFKLNRKFHNWKHISEAL